MPGRRPGNGGTTERVTRRSEARTAPIFLGEAIGGRAGWPSRDPKFSFRPCSRSAGTVLNPLAILLAIGIVVGLVAMAYCMTYFVSTARRAYEMRHKMMADVTRQVEKLSQEMEKEADQRARALQAEIQSEFAKSRALLERMLTTETGRLREEIESVERSLRAEQFRLAALRGDAAEAS